MTKNRNKKESRVSFRAPQEFVDFLEQEKTKHGESKSVVMRRIVRQFLPAVVATPKPTSPTKLKKAA